jgi:hypothetical protein
MTLLQSLEDAEVGGRELDASKWTLREAGHFNGGKEWFGYLMRCDQQPRLARFDRYSRRDKSVTSTWRVDGRDVRSLADALGELAHPPRLTIGEISVLVAVGTEPADLRRVHPYETMSALRDKGAIAYGPPGRCRRVMSDSEVLDQLSRLESNASGNPEWESVSVKVSNARAALLRALQPEDQPHD